MKTKGIASFFNKEFVGTDHLRKNLTKILKELKRKKELVVTQSGKPKAMLLDFERYFDLIRGENGREEGESNTIGNPEKTVESGGGRQEATRSGTVFSFRKDGR